MRSFRRADHLYRPPRGRELEDDETRYVLGEPRRGDIPKGVRKRLLEQYPKIAHRNVFRGMRMISTIGPGDQVPMQRFLVKRAVMRLRETGIDVILIEMPIHPEAASLAPLRLRKRFLNFATNLSQKTGMIFVPLEEMPTFTAEDFADPIHLGRLGSAKLTPFVADRIYRVLQERGEQE